MTTLSPHLVSCRPPDLIFLGSRGKLGRAAGTGGPPSVWGPTQQLRVQQRGGKPSLPAKKKSVSREACTQLSGTLPVWGTHLSTENNPVTCSRRSVDGYTAAALQTEWQATDRRPSLSVRASRETRKGPGHRSWGSREEPVLPWGTSTGTRGPRVSQMETTGAAGTGFVLTPRPLRRLPLPNCFAEVTLTFRRTPRERCSPPRRDRRHRGLHTSELKFKPLVTPPDRGKSLTLSAPPFSSAVK